MHNDTVNCIKPLMAGSTAMLISAKEENSHHETKLLRVQNKLRLTARKMEKAAHGYL